MDVTTVVGVLIGAFMIAFAVFFPYISDASAMRTIAELFFYGTGAWSSALIVLGGTFAATLMNYPLNVVVSVFKVLKQVFAPTGGTELATWVDDLVHLAEETRRSGLMALDNLMGQITSPFLKKGLQLAMTESDPVKIENILVLEVEHMKARHRDGQDLFKKMASYAPAFGMLGTVVGLIQMLQSQAGANPDPKDILPGMAVALITTFYGVILANLFFTPIAGKLKTRSEHEVLVMEMQIEAVLSIQAQDAPSTVREKLLSFLSPRERGTRR